MDEDNTVVIDLTEMLDMDHQTRIRMNLPGDRVFVFRPITAIQYYSYMDAMQKSNSRANSLELLKECLIEPDMTVKELGDLLPGETITMFNHLLNASFLRTSGSMVSSS